MTVFFHKPHHGPPGQERQLLADCFEKIRSNRGISIVYPEVSWTNWQSEIEKLLEDGNLHVIYIPETWIPELAAKGILMNLSECAAQSIDQWKPYYPESIFRTGEIDGQQVGIPVYGAVWCFMYNARLFQEAGIPTAPKSWRALWTCAEMLKARFPDVLPYGLNDNSDGHFVDHGLVYLLAGGLSNWFDSNGQFRFDNAWSVKGLSFLQKMVKHHYANVPSNASSEWIREQLFSGKIAMTVGPSDWLLWQRQHDPEFPLRVAMMPYPAGGRPLSFSSCGFYCLVCGDERRNRYQEGIELLEELVHPTLLKRHIETIGMLPVQNGMSLYENDEKLLVFSKQVKESGDFPSSAFPFFPTLIERMVACLSMETSPAEALRSVSELMSSKGGESHESIGMDGTRQDST